MWKDNLISRKSVFESFQRINQNPNEVLGVESEIKGPEVNWLRVLVDYLAAA